jgi:hypothetical protein
MCFVLEACGLLLISGLIMLPAWFAGAVNCAVQLPRTDQQHVHIHAHIPTRQQALTDRSDISCISKHSRQSHADRLLIGAQASMLSSSCMHGTTSMHPRLLTATYDQLQPLRSDQKQAC